MYLDLYRPRGGTALEFEFGADAVLESVNRTFFDSVGALCGAEAGVDLSGLLKNYINLTTF